MKTFLLVAAVGGAALALVLLFFLGTPETTTGILEPAEQALPSESSPMRTPPGPAKGSGDAADGLRVWDDARGVHELHELQIRSVEFLPTAAKPQWEPPRRLYGTVRTSRGRLTGFVQWNHTASLATDELVGRTAEADPDGDTDEEVRLRFDSLRSLARISEDSTHVTHLDGRQRVLTGHPDVGGRHRGVVVDDPRFGRILVPWQEFQRLDFDTHANGTGRAYGDFPAGCPLRGTVSARDGRRRAGRLVYDLDESETTETLDAPASGLHHTLPFEQIALIVLDHDDGSRHADVTLRSGVDLRLERRGDLGGDNAGLLVFSDDAKSAGTPDYVPWDQVRRIDFDAAPCPSATTSSRGR